MPPFQPSYLGNVEAFARTFFRELFRTESPYLVFDNYQEAMDESVRRNIVLAAAWRDSRRGPVFVLSRTEPPASFAGLRAQGRITVIGWNDLRLTAEECRGVAKARGVALRDADLEKVAHAHRGWVAGLVLLLQGWRARAPAQPGAAAA